MHSVMAFTISCFAFTLFILHYILHADGNKKADWQVTLEKKKGKKMFDDQGNLLMGDNTGIMPCGVV